MYNNCIEIETELKMTTTLNFSLPEELTRQEELQSIYWDMYKDAYGVRPRGIDTSNWTEYAFKVEFEHLAITIEANEIARCKQEAESVVKFDKRVATLIECGAKNRETAIRWIHEAEGTGGDNSYLAWTLGLPYNYFTI